MWNTLGEVLFSRNPRDDRDPETSVPPHSRKAPEIKTITLSQLEAPFSPYRIASEDGLAPNCETSTDLVVGPTQTPFYDKRYYLPRTVQPLPDDMHHLLRKELERMFFEESAIKARSTDPFNRHWSRGRYWMRSFTEHELRGGPITGGATQEHVHEYFNKHVAVYFETGRGPRAYEDQKMARYIFRLWYRMHAGRPPLQRFHFFGKAICFGDRVWGCDVPESRPRSIFPDVWSFHGRLCDSLGARQEELVRFRLRDQGTWPKPGEDVRSWEDHGFALGHLFRALFVVVDDQVTDKKGPGDKEPRAAGHLDVDSWDTTYKMECHPMRLGNEDYLEYRNRRAEKLFADYTVLLAKTGDDKHLSAPVSFAPLSDSGETLLVNRDDLGRGRDGEVVRVNVDVAVQFVLDLIRREEAALPHLEQRAKDLEEEQRVACEKWVLRVLRHAEHVGVDRNGYTWNAIRRVRARLNGEAFDCVQVRHPAESLTHWDM